MTHWDDNFIQFPALLAGIAASVPISREVLDNLCERMDVPPVYISEILDRAEVEFARIEKGELLRRFTPYKEIRDHANDRE